MKRFGLLIMLFTLLLVISSPFAMKTKAYAVNEEVKNYLVNPDYQQNKDFYGISEEEVIRLSRPFNGKDGMMEGQSFAPTYADNKIDRLYSTNSVQISNSDALYVYVYFGELNSKNLKIVLSGLSFSLTWNISAEAINEQIDETTSSSRIRYGWVQLYLPVLAAEADGSLGEIKNLHILYGDTESADKVYSKPYFYAPYISSSNSGSIEFLNKQNYYNLKFSLDNSANFCAGDKLTISNLKSIFDYCIIGDIDYLQNQVSTYKVLVEITNTSSGTKSDFNISNSLDYTFTDTGNYLISALVYSENICLWQTASMSINVKNFVAFYLDSAIADMKVGETSEYTIIIGQFASSVSNFSVTSSNPSVAEAKIENGKLKITTKKSGKSTIKISATASRGDFNPLPYSTEYTITVKSDTSVNWSLMIVLAIGLIICTIVVYTIMVRRRLIKNKYPKY